MNLFGIMIRKTSFRKSVHQVALENLGSPSLNWNSRTWNKLWGLPIPQNIKHFIWKACNEAIPTKANHFKCKIYVNVWCSQCNCKAETTYHCLLFCYNFNRAWFVPHLATRPFYLMIILLLIGLI